MSDSIPDALLPCPFCGGRAKLAEGRNADGTPFEYIECSACAAMAELDFWNQRSGSKALRSIMLLAAREMRTPAVSLDKNREMWGHVLRICREASILPVV